MRPFVGLSQTIPVKAAGNLTLPPVSVPRAAIHSLPATAAAEPQLLPPATLVLSHGLRTGPNTDVSLEEPIANSSILALLIISHHACSRLLTHVAVYGEVYHCNILDPQVI
jgi:hypothetical protein